MIKKILKICIGLMIMLLANPIISQNVTIDYATFSSSACNVFGVPVTINGITHQTTIGQPKYNSTNSSIQMDYNYNNNAQKGTEYKISYNFKANYSYTITLTMRNATPNGVVTGAELRGSFGDNGSSSVCNGVQLITGNSTSLTTPSLNSNIFQDYVYDTATLSSAVSYVRFTTRTDFIPDPQVQVIEIKKIVINEIPPPPSFTLSPTSLTLPCNDTSAKTFTVSTANIPNGANLTYNWSYPGWSGTSSNSNTITLTPTSGTTLPSSISVTPILNSVAQTTKTCAVTRAAFSSIAMISGTTGICSGSSNYTISNIGAGQTVAWSLSNPGIATLSNQTNSGATVSFSGSGAQTLTALITNACLQSTTKTFVINDGSPTFTSAATISGNSSFCTGSNTYTISGILAAQTVVWSLSDPSIASLSGTSNSQATVNFTGSGPQTLSATITNSCGQTTVKTFQIYGGVPTLSSFTCGMGAPFCDGTVCLCDSCLPSLDASSLLTANMSGQTGIEAGQAANWQWQKINNKIQTSTNKQKCYISGSALGATGIQVRAKNACGWSQWYTLNFDVVSCSRMAAVVDSKFFTISPNPAKDVVNIELV